MEIINALGLSCPAPVIELTKAIDKLNGSGEFKVLVDNVIATENLSKMCRQKGFDCNVLKLSEKEYEVIVSVSEEALKASREMFTDKAFDEMKNGLLRRRAMKDDVATSNATPSNIPAVNYSNNSYIDLSEKGRTVVAISKNRMGNGDDELGAILIKGFIYSLANLEYPPRAVVFFNSGVKLATSESNTLHDLTELAAKGCKIMVCGTCVDFFGLKDKLKVGEIVNMYDIVSAMNGADKVINI